MAKKKGQTPPRAVRMEARGRPGQITPTADRARKRRRANLITAAVLLVIVGAAVTAAVLTVTDEDRELPGVSSATAPWPAETSRLSRRLASLDLPPFREGAGAFHNHIHLDVFVDGVRTPVPGNIGITETFFAAIHTHDETGVIHIEADSAAVFTLGDVFDIWGVRLTADCVGGYCKGQDGLDIELYVNGEKQSGNPGDYELKEHDQVALVIGEPPEEIPDSYDFSSTPTEHPTPTPTGSAAATPSPTGS